MELRKLNQKGLQCFAEYIQNIKNGSSDATDQVPKHLLKDKSTSDPLNHRIIIKKNKFPDRLALGKYLNKLLDRYQFSDISNDKGLWSAMALHWFDLICQRANEKWKLGESYRYILSDGYQNYYRHMIRTPWQLVHQHGDKARCLLVRAPGERKLPLSIHSDIIEQLLGRQHVLASTEVVEVIDRLYYNPAENRIKRGVSSTNKGSVRRFAKVFLQLDLTYDIGSMTADELLDLLPEEFNRWKQ